MRPTLSELGRIARTCDVAESAFRESAIRLATGISEREANLRFAKAHCRGTEEPPEVTPAKRFFYCMSGPNGARASAAFQQANVVACEAALLAIAIGHEDLPQLHSCSEEPLEPGMVINAESSMCVDDYDGMCERNRVAVTDDGYALLSPFQRKRSEWGIA